MNFIKSIHEQKTQFEIKKTLNSKILFVLYEQSSTSYKLYKIVDNMSSIFNT